MNSAEYVTQRIAEMKSQGTPLAMVAWQAALLCVGWPYVFGARWQYCTPANRRARYSDDHPTIKTACKNYNGSGSANCKGCKWYPSEKYTRINDCRGFIYGILKAVYGWELMGAGCTSQWNNEANWKAKGTVADGIPADTLVCLFVKKGKTMEHTGFCLNNETVECSSGVQHFTSRNKKWTDWGIPACVDTDIPTPTPTPEPTPEKKPTLRKGDSGKWVTLARTELINKGYDCGKTGADGKFGANTEKAVKAFQKDNGLTVDGIIGANTWNALDGAEPAIRYTVTIPGLTASQADALIKQYPNGTKSEERG